MMTIEELVDYLELPKEQLLQLAHAGRLPGEQAAASGISIATKSTAGLTPLLKTLAAWDKSRSAM